MISGKRPFLVLSKDQMNDYFVVVAPIISTMGFPASHIPISKGVYPIKNGVIRLDCISQLN